MFPQQKTETDDGGEADLILLDLQESLKMIVQHCPAWGDALLEAHAAAGGWLTLVTYHDEIVCGNVLAFLKRKKYSAFYLSFKEMRCHLRLEQAWLPAMTLPRELIDKIAGGLGVHQKRLRDVVGLYSGNQWPAGPLQATPTKSPA